MTPPPRIMVVDDNRGTRVVLSSLLEEEGYQVVACQTAEEALQIPLAAEHVQMVISDLRLPDGTGLQVLWALKKISPNSDFILVTGHATLETAMLAPM